LGLSGQSYCVQEKPSQQLNFISSQGLATLGLAGCAPSFGASGEFKAPRDIPLTIGIAYRHQAPIDLTGNAHFEGVPANFASSLQDQGATERIVVPNDFYVGAAYDVRPNVKVMASWNLERWRVYRSDTYIGDKGLVISVPRDYHNAWVWRFGGEFTKLSFAPKLTLRGGFLRSVSNQPTNTISPTLTDASSWALSVGAGYEFIPNLRADIGYQFAFFDKVTATPDAFPGSYDTHVHLLSAGVTYRIPSL
jgi:long-subunit fatty acid transport protein